METPMEIFKSEDGKVQRRASIEELEEEFGLSSEKMIEEVLRRV